MNKSCLYGYRITNEKNDNKNTPIRDVIRPILFWDVKLGAIDWDRHTEFVISQVFR